MLRMTMRNTTMNCWDTPGWISERLNQRWKEFERSWRKTFDWWQIILTSNFEMNLSITLGKLGELGKILGKDLWVRAHSKDTPLNDFEREIAPVELNGLNKVIPRNSLKGLRIETWIFWDIFSTPEQLNSTRRMIKSCTGMRKHLKRGKGMIDKAWIESTGEEKRAKNDKFEASWESSWESAD